MKRLDSLKQKTKKIKEIKTPTILSALKVTIIAEHIFSKTSKKISGILAIHSKEKIKIKSIQYTIAEDIDPIVWKRKEDAEILASHQTKKWFTLAPDIEKEVSFSLPILFENIHKKNKTWWDMYLLNHMSEKSKKTAINYVLTTEVRYILDWEKESKIKKSKHEIRFE